MAAGTREFRFRGGDLLTYLLIGIPAIVVAGVVYATKKQSRVTAAFATAEPDVDLTFRVPEWTETSAKPETDSMLAELVEQSRDPKLAKMSDKELIMEVLKECYDPEIPLNIVDLGLIYDVEVKRDAINVRMSLTTPGCPSSQEISQDVRAKLEEAGFPSPKVELVWDPPWSAHRISEYGKKQLGL